MTVKKLLHKLGHLVFVIGSKWFGGSNRARAEKRGARLTRLVNRLDRKHRERTTANLELVFPEKSVVEREAIARGMVDHFGFVLADFAGAVGRDHTVDAAQMTCEGFENLEAALALGKGVIMVSAHLGNFERFAMWFNSRGLLASAVARDANDEDVTSDITQLRQARGIRIMPRGNAAREILIRLKQGEIVVIMPDQNADDAFIPFFGKMAGTVLGPAVLSKKTKAPIVPACILRTGVGTYKVVIRPHISMLADESVEEYMTRINGEIEQLILLAPEQYLWMHDRWKNARRKGLL
jgi:Kdo2-lipid IVA lauroyltransferase/acyltransferase